ncbi:hypothetical protein DSC45_21045 [Streptomyces sp. YIM 130001]|uniref:DUF742 domain-containing protein n=1 Tax=Streptomyces sp. YIM 130001 TaxID=2259644 RepID=UPI000E650281|nr:DUF742 domain-containing protein [Streptomyces sp. YIM 130001]RII14176.1 hypothetical protein DSC45_21045 [Streptomyces sp. YIM 130001]
MSDAWTDRYDDDAGPLVRLYAMTAGRARTENGAERVDLMAIVRTTGTALSAPLPPEQRALLDLCAGAPRPVADLASDSGLPLGVVRVLLGDLTAHGLVRISPPSSASDSASTAHRPDARLLREVIHGLRTL